MDEMTPPNATEIAVELAEKKTKLEMLLLIKEVAEEAKDKEELQKRLEQALKQNM